MDNFIETWGYWAVFMGIVLEGEVAYLTGILASEISHLTIYGVIGLSFLGAVTRDGLLFAISRYSRKSVLLEKYTKNSKIDRMSTWLERKPSHYLVFYRFFYGISTLIVLTFAFSPMTIFRYFIICLTGTTLWAMTYGLLGYLAAREIIRNLHFLNDNFGWIALFIFSALFISFLYKRRRSLKISKLD